MTQVIINEEQFWEYHESLKASGRRIIRCMERSGSLKTYVLVFI